MNDLLAQAGTIAPGGSAAPGAPTFAPPAGGLPPAGPGPKGLPHDLRGLLPYETPWWEYALWALAGALALALIAALILWLRKRPKKIAPAPPVDPWAVLKDRISRLQPEPPFDPGRPQEDYFYNLSMLLREAVELRTRIPATDLTVQELRQPLRKRLPLPGTETEQLLAFLDRADLVKFAGMPSTVAEAGECRDRVAAWVRSLTPRSIDVSPWDQERSTAEGRRLETR